MRIGMQRHGVRTQRAGAGSPRAISSIGLVGLCVSISAFCLLTPALGAQVPKLAQPFTTVAAPVVDVFFSDQTAVIVAGIKSAQRHIRVQAYSFTSAPIAQALIAARARGVDVQVLVDHGSALSTDAKTIKELTTAGIDVAEDARHAIAHNKIVILDGEIVITGSFNFTSAAEKRNAENIVVIRDDQTAQRFMANWNLHQSHCTPIK